MLTLCLTNVKLMNILYNGKTPSQTSLQPSLAQGGFEIIAALRLYPVLPAAVYGF
jgi:hypothetical protein